VSPFTPRPVAPDPEEEATLAWLQETLDRLAPERGMPAGATWQVQPGVRETGGAAGPRLRQTGFQITAHDATGSPWRLTCFVNGEDVQEDEFRPAVEEVLGLWLDRLSDLAPG
jgi:hypothetical protein